MIGTSRLRAIRRIDHGNGWVEAEAGVVNLDVTRAVADRGCFYAPDPSSQAACTIGGNVAENSGGPHTLKYGVTLNHLLGLELVLPNGDLLRIERSAVPGGYDLIGILAGSEGTLGIVTAATLRILPRPQGVATMLAIFPDVVSACRGVSAIISSGVLPAALELMDSLIARAVESIFRIGLPQNAGAVLLIELDGLTCGLETACERVERACRLEGASEIRRARDEQERESLWKCRKRAFGAMGRLAPSYCTQDGVVPRSRLPEIAERVEMIASRHRLRIANLMHAGDGNIHPILLYDERNDDEVHRVLQAGEEILDACLALGGSITGEHGIGVEKLALMSRAFSPETIAAMTGVREVFNPRGLCNPGKVLPSDRGCIEIRRPRPRGGG
jgi:glycolate oxidase